MDVSFMGTVNQLKNSFSNLNKKTKMTIIISSVVFVLIAVFITLWLNNDDYVALYKGLSNIEYVEILNKLESMAIDVKIQKDGTILVPKKDEARLKMALAMEGYPYSDLNYDVFSSGSDFMSTDYEKQKYFIFQIQNRLQDAIKTIQGVNNAIVTISITDENSFVLKSDKVPTTASVVLNLKGNTELNKKQIKGIEGLVAKSVPGLQHENVVIIDNSGVILNNNNEFDNIDSAYTKLELINSINSLYKEKITALLEPVFGKNGISVAVNTTVDFDKKTTEETVFTPIIDENGIISRQEYTKESINGGTVPGGVPGTGSNTGTPVYQQTDPNGADNSATEKVSTEYLVNQIIKNIQNDGGEIKDMSVSIMINSSELSTETIESYRRIVANSVGIPTNKVVITSAEFKALPQVIPYVEDKNEKEDPFMNFIKEYKYYILAGIGLLLILFILLIILLIRSRKKRISEQKKAQEYAAKLKKKSEKDPGEILLNDTHEQTLKKHITDFSSANPDIVAQLIRTWLKEDDNN